MSKINIVVNLYQNIHGEICAFVSYDEDEQSCDKLVENIEKFALTSDVMLEYLLDGFGDFSDYDSLQFNGKSIDTVLIEWTEDENYELIVHFEPEYMCADYFFEHMDDFAKTLFQNVKMITDKKQGT